MTFKSLTALALAAVLLPLSPVHAADYDPPIYVDQAPDYQPVEVGSGWYLRGDVGYAINKPYEFSETPAGFSTNTQGFSGSVGMGYHFNDYLRGELNFGMLPTSSFDNAFVTTCARTQTTTVVNSTGAITSQISALESPVASCNGSNNGQNRAFDGMASAFVDLGTYVGFTPYVGGGVGIAYTSYSLTQNARRCVNGNPVSTTDGSGNTTTVTVTCLDPSNYTGTVSSEKQFSLAYSLDAGFAYQVSKNLSLDVGYQYVALPSAKYVSFDNTGTPSINKGLSYQSVKLGLRYDLW